MNEVQYWNDYRLQASNPGVALPAEKILPVARADVSGQSEIFTTILSIINPTWRRLYGAIMSPNFVDGTCCNSTAWPPGVVRYFGMLLSGIVGLVASIPYTIGFADLNAALNSAAGIANLFVTSGKISINSRILDLWKNKLNLNLT